MEAPPLSLSANFFVYGTLMAGQRNSHWWPARPIDIHVAWMPGKLYDLIDYPALVEGNDRILGELWRFAPSDADQVIRALDELEGTNLKGQADWYQRVQRTTQVAQAGLKLKDLQDREFSTSQAEWQPARATCYLYLRELTEQQRLPVSFQLGNNMFSRWTRPAEDGDTRPE